MHPVAHTYVARKVCEANQIPEDRANNVIAGSIVNDVMMLEGNGNVSFADFEPYKLDLWINKVQNKDLALGMLTHATVDDVSHGGYVWGGSGYSYGTWWKAHWPNLNPKSKKMQSVLHILFPEADMDFYLLKMHPETAQILFTTIENVDVYAIGKDLASAMDRDPKIVSQMLTSYFRIVPKITKFMRKFCWFANKEKQEECLELCIQKCEEKMPFWKKLLGRQ